MNKQDQNKENICKQIKERKYLNEQVLKVKIKRNLQSQIQKLIYLKVKIKF